MAVSTRMVKSSMICGFWTDENGVKCCTNHEFRYHSLPIQRMRHTITYYKDALYLFAGSDQNIKETNTLYIIR
jgi:hypothetical protein